MVGDGEMAITEPFGGSVLRSTRSPRAFVSNILPAPCRACGGPSWLTDDIGSVHPCCRLSWTEITGCLSCRASDKLNKEHRRRELTGRLKVSKVISSTKGELPLESES